MDIKEGRAIVSLFDEIINHAHRGEWRDVGAKEYRLKYYIEKRTGGRVPYQPKPLGDEGAETA